MVVRAVSAAVTATNATANGASYTPTVANATFRITCYVDCTVGTTMSMSVTYTYKDTAGGTVTDTMPLTTAAGLVLLNGLIITTGRYMATVTVNTAGALTAITVQTAGTVTTTTYTLSSTIEELQVGL